MLDACQVTELDPAIKSRGAARKHMAALPKSDLSQGAAGKGGLTLPPVSGRCGSLFLLTPRKADPMADPENTLILETTRGKVTIALKPDLAPNHVARIKELAREGFYDGIVFHRVIEDFMAQCGCPKGTGTGGSRKPDLKQEFSAAPHVRGTCSMARTSDPNSANSQFFICFGDAGFLDRQYTVWGQVTDGMDAIDALKRGEPVRNPDSIISMKVLADL